TLRERTARDEQERAGEERAKDHSAITPDPREVSLFRDSRGVAVVFSHEREIEGEGIRWRRDGRRARRGRKTLLHRVGIRLATERAQRLRVARPKREDALHRSERHPALERAHRFAEEPLSIRRLAVREPRR